MKKAAIFNYAKSEYDGSLNYIKSSSFKVIERIIRSLANLEITEEEKISRMIQMLTSIKNSPISNIMGVKTAEIVKIVDNIFDISKAKINNPVISQMTIQEILYYYCTVERLVETRMDFDYERRIEIETKNKEKERIAEIKRIAEEERKREETEVLREREKTLSALSEAERKIYEMNEKNTEEASMELYNEIDKFEGEDKLKIANALKEFWSKSSDKWEGKLSKKQKLKVDKIKSIIE